MTDQENALRVFLAFGLPDNVREHFSEFPVLQHAEKVHMLNFHITLRFLDVVTPDQCEAIQEKISQIRKSPFPIVVKGLGQFERKKGAVVYAGIENHRPIHDLAARIGEKLQPLGFMPPERFMIPHISLYKHATNKQAVEKYIKMNSNEVRATWIAERFHLYQSVERGDGRGYEILDTYPLF